jgi:D-aminoacyl-tRNA deacylase
MRTVVQRVNQAAVRVTGQTVGSIGKGLLVLLGITQGDQMADARWMAEKIIGLRIFEDAQGKMNLELADVNGKLLVVSQFTLYGDCQKGKRPSFVAAARPEEAIPLYEEFIAAARRLGVEVHTGQFGAAMQVELVNDGPVTLFLERGQTDPAVDRGP